VLKSYETELPDGQEQSSHEVETFTSSLNTNDDPNIIGYYGAFYLGEGLNIILEYANGGTLEEFMQNNNPPDQPEDVNALWEALLGLVHGLRTIHNLTLPDSGAISEDAPDGASVGYMYAKIQSFAMTNAEYVAVVTMISPHTTYLFQHGKVNHIHRIDS
jgi:serine/threonine protein kinase